MIGYVRIPDDICAAIFAHARESFPAECCGYLRGDRASQTDAGTATDLVRCRNAQPDGEHPTHPERTSETGFVIAGRELFEFARAFQTDRPPLVVYHSHTNGRAYFSEVDRQSAVAAAGGGRREPVYAVQHLVVGVTADGTTEAAIFAWSVDDEDFVEVARFDARC